VAQATIVDQWLAAYGAHKYAKAFSDKGLKELPEVTDEIISAIVSDDPSLAKKLSESLKKLNRGPDPQPSPGPGPDIPDLPPRTTLDLSREKVQVKGFPEFSIPSYLSVGASTNAITHPDKLSQLDWMIIARNRRIVHNGNCA
jgi:hypothetical protein